jgi:serine/threonine protein kinase
VASRASEEEKKNSIFIVIPALLGTGSRKKVTMAFNPLNPEDPWCAHAINLETTGTRAADDLLRESQVLRQFQSPHIIEALLGEKSSPTTCHLVMPLCSETLEDAWQERQESQPDSIIYMLAQAAEGLEWLHGQKRVVHCDISPWNIMVRGEPLNPHTVKICDLGMVRPLQSLPPEDEPPAGIYFFRAPEIIDWQQRDDALREEGEALIKEEAGYLRSIRELEEKLLEIDRRITDSEIIACFAQDNSTEADETVQELEQLKDEQQQLKSQYQDLQTLYSHSLSRQQAWQKRYEELLGDLVACTQPSMDIWAFACAVLHILAQSPFFPKPCPLDISPSLESLRQWQPARDLPQPFCSSIPGDSSMDQTLRKIFSQMLVFDRHGRCSAQDVANIARQFIST